MGGYVLSHFAFWQLASGKSTPTVAWINEQDPQDITASAVTVGWVLAEISIQPVARRKNAETRVRNCAGQFETDGRLHKVDLPIADRWSQLLHTVVRGQNGKEADQLCKWAWATALAHDMAYVECSDFDYGPLLTIGLRIFDPVEGKFVGNDLGL